MTLRTRWQRLRGVHQQPVYQHAGVASVLLHGHRDGCGEHVRGAGQVVLGGGEAESLLQRLHVEQRDSDQVRVEAVVKSSTKYDKTIYCVNCGDSRSVLCRNGTCIELSVCHDTNNENEVRRVLEVGGCVCARGIRNRQITNGRVMGVMQVTRSLGDIEYKTMKEYYWNSHFSVCDSGFVVRIGRLDLFCSRYM